MKDQINIQSFAAIIIPIVAALIPILTSKYNSKSRLKTELEILNLLSPDNKFREKIEASINSLLEDNYSSDLIRRKKKRAIVRILYFSMFLILGVILFLSRPINLKNTMHLLYLIYAIISLLLAIFYPFIFRPKKMIQE